MMVALEDEQEDGLKSVFVIFLTLFYAGATLACSPAPSCWIDEGPAYLKDLCHQSAKNPSVLKYVDEPDQIGRFIRACARLHIAVKRPR